MTRVSLLCLFPHRSPLPRELIAVVRVCVMQKVHLEALLAFARHVRHLQSTAVDARLRCDSLRELLLDDTAFLWPDCSERALHVLESLLARRHSSVLAAKRRTDAVGPSAEGVSPYRLQCAREYCNGQAELLGLALQHVRDCIRMHYAAIAAAPALPATLSTPLEPVRWFRSPERVVAVQTCQATATALTAPWFVPVPCEADSIVVSWRIEEVLNTLGESSAHAARVVVVA
jgi:hypothetical protein